MQIDNGVYDRMGGAWWDEENPLNMLHGSMTPARFDYCREVLARSGLNGVGLRALDIGSGGGFLAEEFARLGCQVTGVDPSVVSVKTARAHATSSGLDIRYLVGAGEQLPFQDGEFDLAYCCDVLEHVSDLDQVVAETARVVKPGGLYFFDTLNRTPASKVLAIKVMQEWRLTRVIDTPLHVWDLFIKPAELGEILQRHGFQLEEVVGLGPRAPIPRVLLGFVRASRGRISYGELSRRVKFGRTRSTAVSYMGFASKI